MMIGARFNNNKAGMNVADRGRIERIIAENTNSEFEGHEQKRTKRIESRIRRNQQLLSEITEEQIKRTESELNKTIEEMEGRRKLDRVKVHIDMDAFFAAVECRDNPQLRTIPMAVGSDSMLSTSNYIARKFGVRSAMPGFIAKKLCPQLVIVRGHFSKYRRESYAIREIFRRYDPDVSMGSLDEAYLDISDFMTRRNTSTSCKRIRYAGPCVCRLPLLYENSEINGNPEKFYNICSKCAKERIEVIDSVEFGIEVNSVVNQLRFEVEQATGLTCSAGIAPNSLLSKICSDLNKPNGQYRLMSNRNDIKAFMNSLPIRKVPGIGAVSEALLKAIGVNNCGDLFEKRSIIRLLFSRHTSEWLLRISLGLSREVMDRGDSDSMEEAQGESNPKSNSIERTFAPTKKLEELLYTIHTLCIRLIESLPSSDIVGGRSATLKVKFANFDVITRCKSVNFTICTAEELFQIMNTLLRKEMKETDKAIRLLGVRLSQLVFVDDNAEAESKHGGIQKSLADFVLRRPPKKGSGSPPPLVELGSSDEETVQDEQDLLDTSIGELLCEGEEKEAPKEKQTNNTDEASTSAQSEQMDIVGTTASSRADYADNEEEEREKDDVDDAEEIIFVDEVVSAATVGNLKNAPTTTATNWRRSAKGRKPNVVKGRRRVSKKSAWDTIHSSDVNNLHNYFPTIL